MKSSRAFTAAAAVLFAAVLAFALAQTSPPSSSSSNDRRSQALRLNNLGVGYMNQQRFDAALEHFERAHKLLPELGLARLNQGIALLNLQRFEPARQIFEEIIKQQPDNARAWYNLGLLHKNQGEVEPALAVFQKATEPAPDDPDAWYFLGWAHTQSQQFQPAIAAYERAIKLNPFHVSAEFGLARAYQRTTQPDRARAHLARYQRLMQEKLGAPLSLAYGDQGPLSLAEHIPGSPQPAPEAIPVKFVDATKAAGLPVSDHKSAAACFLDFDGDHRPDLLLLAPGGPTLHRNQGNGRFKPVANTGLKVPAAPIACAVGDYDNDRRPDLAISHAAGVSLFRNEGEGKFSDATKSAGLAASGAPSGVTFVDYDHDGDLDLFLAGGNSASALWRNNGNATFTDVTAVTGLDVVGANAAAATDFNNDRAIDFLFTGALEPALYLNPREGKFTAMEPWKDSSGSRAVVFDFDKDGWMDVVLSHSKADSSPAVSLWRNQNGRTIEQAPLPELKEEAGSALAVLDFDNDGWLDLAYIGDNRLRLLRNLGNGKFADVSEATGLTALKLTGPRTLIAADYDLDGDTDLLVTTSDGVVLLRNDGGNQNHSLRLALEGLNDNKSAIGTKVEVFAGDLWQKFEIQTPGDLLVGLGQHKQADVVRMLWPTGVVQDELELAAGERHAILEIDRRGSSCPILFAWDGERFGFITDVIGAGIFGHWVAPGQRNRPDPNEYVKIDGRRLRPRHGRLSLRLLEPMEELVYLDHVKLIAVDRPADVAVFPNERFSAIAPQPEFKVIASRDLHPPAAARDDRGRDLLPALLHRDRQYVEDFALSQFKGFAEPHVLELDLGEPYTSGPLHLLMHGFIDYFTATSVYAAHQAGVTAIVPYVEALTPAGKWVRVVDDMGFPAGLSRTMVADLSGRLPAGTRRIRITTNLQIYWDQVLIDRGPAGPFRLTEVPLAHASLGFHGYPRAIEGRPAGDLDYDFHQVSLTGPYARHAGHYTRYGDVRPLLAAVEDRFVVFGSGEMVELEFDATVVPLPPDGWQRDYFVYVHGYDKDMDFYALNHTTVEPLPSRRMRDFPRSTDLPDLDYMLEFNTRPLSGREPSAYRFDYRDRAD